MKPPFPSRLRQLLGASVLLSLAGALGTSCTTSQPRPDHAAGAAGEMVAEGGAESTGGDHNSGDGGQGAGGETEMGPLASSCSEGFSSQPPAITDCGARATGDSPLLDDFADGNLMISPLEQRSGQWYVYTDETRGCVNLSIQGDTSALHVTGEGFSDWGAGFGTALGWSAAAGNACTYDLSAYSGVRFRARGSASLYMNLATRDSNPENLGGSCEDGEGCYDRHGRTVLLTSSWQDFSVDFCTLSQEGWGASLPAFDPTTVTNLNFHVRSTQAFEVWIDDVEFIPHEGSEPQACGPLCPLDRLPAGLEYDPAETPKQGGAPGLELLTFEQPTPDCGPLLRRYLTYVPDSLDDGTDAAVLLVLPGTSSDAESMHSFMTGERFVTLADRDGFIVAYANGAPGPYTVSERPNGGRFWLSNQDSAQVDDREYLRLIIDDLQQRGTISGDNPVFLVGHSIGGGLALAAALESPQLYQGIAPIMPFEGIPPREPDPEEEYALDRFLLAYTHGDPDLPAGYHDYLEPLAVAWAEALGLSTQDPEEQMLPDQVVEGEGYGGDHPIALRTRDSRVTRIDYTSANSDRAVRVLEFDRAGHFWPMPNPYEDAQLVWRYGFRNQDINLGDQVWDFFKSSL